MAGLAGALTLACPQGYVRVFADEGAPMAALLGQLIASQRAGHAAAEIPIAFLARLRRAFDAAHVTPDPGAGTTAAVPGIVEPLTSRELEVLRMLAAGRSNQAIAGQFFVTLDTVKKHVSHVLSKLGAANRTEAVSRAASWASFPERPPHPASVRPLRTKRQRRPGGVDRPVRPGRPGQRGPVAADRAHGPPGPASVRPSASMAMRSPS